MPALELVAAGLLGLTLLWIAFEPLVIDGWQQSTVDDEAPDDLEATPHGTALVALKDLEFDHATGKLSDADYRDLRARYTRAAVTSLREVDSPAPAAPGPEGTACSGCGGRSPADALFCSGCGHRLG